MAEEQFTRCPACRTIFRVTSEQLSLRSGQVRCGHCRTVFDGVAQRVSLAPTERDREASPDLSGPPTVTLRDARALEPAVADTAAPASTRSAPEIDFERRFAWDRPKRTSRLRAAGYAVAIAALALLLVAQVLHHFRDGLAARYPSLRPTLAALCSVLRCEVRPLRDVAVLSIEASGLESDAAHRGLLILTATVRNRAPYAVAYPHVELTLTDQQDRVVVRRAIAPSEYASAASDLPRGILPHGEIFLKLFIDASSTSQSGYRVYLFYP